MVNTNAQKWLDEKYPINGVCKRDNDPENKNKRREDIIELDISKGKIGKDGEKDLVGSLKLERFTNLRTLIISSQQIVDLDVNGLQCLTELKCQNNQLNNLNVNGCSRLKKINCSNNNHIGELDLSTCIELEEVDINSCSELVADKIKSDLFHDTDNGKLVKIGSQIISAGENDIRNILIIGWTGNGKSNLANSLTDTDQFKTEELSTSITKNFQASDVFEWEKEGKKVKYRVIDNIGFGDTNNLAKEDLLYKVGQGIYSARSGINQILFVAKGRFSPEQIEAFKMFKDFIAEIGITKFTTIVKTGFKDFRSQEKCLEDKETLLTQSEELRKIIESCNDVLYVDNPAMPIIEEEDDEDEISKKEKRARIDNKKRKESRERVLNHLVSNCSEIYKLKNWDNIYNRVADYMKQIEEKEKELKNTGSDLEKEKIESEIKEKKGKIVEQVDLELTAEIGISPKLGVKALLKNVKFSQFFSKK